jgi:hypothetical protein
MAMEATMILLGQQETNWMAAKKLMAKIEFKKNVRDLDPEDIPAPTVNLLIKKYLVNPDFTPESVSNVSHAAGVLTLWARAIIAYADTLQKIDEKVSFKMDQSSMQS